MKLDIKLQAGSRTLEHRAELSPDTLPDAGGHLRFTLDGDSTESDWSQIVPGVYSVVAGGRSYEAQVTTPPGGPSGREGPYVVTVGARHYLVEVRDLRSRRPAGWTAAEGPQEIFAPMPGKIVKILVAENQDVGQGDGLLVIEAMKMQNELHAPRSGRIERIYVREGAGVEAGFKLVRFA